MQEWIRQIIIYVILVTVLRGLIMKPQYEQYFRFFSGIVLILLVVSPVLRVLHQDTAWHDTVEQYLFQMDVMISKSSSQLRRAGDRRLLCSNIRSS